MANKEPQATAYGPRMFSWPTRTTVLTLSYISHFHPVHLRTVWTVYVSEFRLSTPRCTIHCCSRSMCCSWEFVTNLGFDLSIYRGKRPFKWTMVVRVNLSFAWLLCSLSLVISRLQVVRLGARAVRYDWIQHAPGIQLRCRFGCIGCSWSCSNSYTSCFIRQAWLRSQLVSIQ
jgi:hypothetical protein